jgi:hypothetical protein
MSSIYLLMACKLQRERLRRQHQLSKTHESQRTSYPSQAAEYDRIATDLNTTRQLAINPINMRINDLVRLFYGPCVYKDLSSEADMFPPYRIYWELPIAASQTLSGTQELILNPVNINIFTLYIAELRKPFFVLAIPKMCWILIMFFQLFNLRESTKKDIFSEMQWTLNGMWTGKC